MAGRFFGFGKNKEKDKQPRGKQKHQTSLDDEDNDDSYIDSDISCPTEPPQSRVLIPNYPPPRPGSPKTQQKTNQQTSKPRNDYQDPWDSEIRNSNSGRPPKNGMNTSNAYADPYDSQKTPEKVPKQTDYADPFDSMVTMIEKMKSTKKNDLRKGSDDDEGYDVPYEQQITVSNNIVTVKNKRDNYEDPWDAKSKNNLGKPSKKMTPKVDIVNQKIKDDYKDPWDAKTSGSLRSVNSDDTYSEPYDKDKVSVLDGKKPAAQVEDDDDDEYDLPYEERVAIGVEQPVNNTRQVKPLPNTVKAPQITPKPINSNRPPQISQKPIIQNKPSISQKPLSPTRPQPKIQKKPVDDYDAPWEWNQSIKKIQNVEKEFENRFSVGNKQQLKQPKSPPPQQQAQPKKINKNAINLGQINPVEKPARKSSSSSDNFSTKYEIDPNMPLDQQGWFHGPIRRGEAESLLRNQPDSSYLIRNSESSKLDYSLSLRNKSETMHLKITCRKSDGKYILGGNSRPYTTIPQMMHYYSRNKLNIRGAEHIKLEYPVFCESMYFTVEPGT